MRAGFLLLWMIAVMPILILSGCALMALGAWGGGSLGSLVVILAGVGLLVVAVAPFKFLQ